MADHLSTRTIELLAQRSLTPGELLDATRHLASCNDCREKVSQEAGANERSALLKQQLQRGEADGVHLDYELLEAYVDDQLAFNQREEVKRHLLGCSGCQDEVRDLESMRDSLSGVPASASSQAKPSLWQSLGASLRTRPFGVAFVAALILALVLAAFLVLNPNRKPEIVEEIPENPDKTSPGDDLIAPVIPPDPAPTGWYSSVIATAKADGRVANVAALRDLAGRPSTLMGPATKEDRFSVISPVGTVVRLARPTFRWQELKGATQYRVSVFDLNLNLVAQSNWITETAWRPRDAFSRNVVYLWQVTAQKDGREIAAPSTPAPEARFRVLSAARATALNDLPQQVISSPLSLGIIYANEGLLEEAERELRAAIDDNENPELARRLLGSINRIRR